MGLQYRRRVPITRNSWLNVSLRGVSVSARLLQAVTVNTHGRVRVNLSRIAKGLSWTGRL
jgi:Protein of unknown function (DUF4236)